MIDFSHTPEAIVRQIELIGWLGGV